MEKGPGGEVDKIKFRFKNCRWFLYFVLKYIRRAFTNISPGWVLFKSILSKCIKLFAFAFLVLIVGILINSTLDFYNNFAYKKAILKDSPYGMTPLLTNPKDYSSADGFINCGDFVYVEDWISAANGSVVFARVKSKLKEGYVNKELLVPTNLNVKPLISMLLLLVIFTFATRKLYYKFSNQNIV